MYMKKLFTTMLAVSLSVVAICANPTPAKVQSKYESDEESIKFGIIAKPHLSFLLQRVYILFANSEPFIALPTFSPSFDVFGDYVFDSVLGVRVALGYSGQGLVYRDANSLASNQGLQGQERLITRRLHYVTLGVIPQIYIDSAKQFCFCAGLKAGWLSSAKDRRYVGGNMDREVNLLGGEDSVLKRINWVFLGGFNYEAEYGLIIGFEANWGLNNILKIGNRDNYVKTVSGGFNVGYNFAKLLY